QTAPAPLERPAVARLGARPAELALIRPENDEPDSRLRDRRKRVVVGGALGDPHPGGFAAESEDKILDPPRDLQLAIARRQQRQYRMTVRLRDCVAMAAMRAGMQRVAADHRAIRGLAVRLQPSRQRRPDVE